MSIDATIAESTIEAYTLLPSEVAFLVRRRKGNRLAQALLLKYFQENSRFPEKLEDIQPEAINWVAEQLRVLCTSAQKCAAAPDQAVFSTTYQTAIEHILPV